MIMVVLWLLLSCVRCKSLWNGVNIYKWFSLQSITLTSTTEMVPVLV